MDSSALSAEVDNFVIEWVASDDPFTAFAAVWREYINNMQPQEVVDAVIHLMHREDVQARYKELHSTAEEIKLAAVGTGLSDTVAMLREAYAVAKHRGNASAMVTAASKLAELQAQDELTKSKIANNNRNSATSEQSGGEDYTEVMRQLGKELPE